MEVGPLCVCTCKRAACERGLRAWGYRVLGFSSAGHTFSECGAARVGASLRSREYAVTTKLIPLSSPFTLLPRLTFHSSPLFPLLSQILVPLRVRLPLAGASGGLQLVCIDCGAVFNRHSVQAHTSCMTEMVSARFTLPSDSDRGLPCLCPSPHPLPPLSTPLPHTSLQAFLCSALCSQ